MTVNFFKVEFRLANFNKKKKEIQKKICALFNSNGGELHLIATDANCNTTINADATIRPIEQQFKQIVGLYEVHKNIKVLKKEYNTIIIAVNSLSVLCTLNTNLYLPTDMQIAIIQGYDQQALQEIFERRVVEIPELKLPEIFTVGRNCCMRESKTVQFKDLKTEKTACTSLFERIVNNKFAETISAFANACGGSIFYGINDEGIVVGEELHDEKEIKSIKENMETKVNDQIKWPAEVKGSEQCKIKFVPCDDQQQSTLKFIIVLSVLPCLGGVFAKEPESYYIDDKGEVKKISVESWRRNICFKVTESFPEVRRQKWSSKFEERKYMALTQGMEKFRQLGKWESIENVFKNIKDRSDLSVNCELVFLFQITAVNYRKGNYEVALQHLQKFREAKPSTKDPSIFDVEETYSASAIERSRGNLQRAWDIVEDGLRLAENAPAGFTLASLFANGASILNNLISERVSGDDKDFKCEMQKHVKMVEYLCNVALQHLMYINDDYEIAKEELKQRINITLASLYLHEPVSSRDIEISAIKLSESEASLDKLRDTPKLKYNYCRLLLGKSDLYFRKYHLTKKGTAVENLKESLDYVQQTQKLADNYSFEEIKGLCESRKEKLRKEALKCLQRAGKLAKGESFEEVKRICLSKIQGDKLVEGISHEFRGLCEESFGKDVLKYFEEHQKRPGDVFEEINWLLEQIDNDEELNEKWLTECALTGKSSIDA